MQNARLPCVVTVLHGIIMWTSNTMLSQFNHNYVSVIYIPFIYSHILQIILKFIYSSNIKVGIYTSYHYTINVLSIALEKIFSCFRMAIWIPPSAFCTSRKPFDTIRSNCHPPVWSGRNAEERRSHLVVQRGTGLHIRFVEENLCKTLPDL